MSSDLVSRRAVTRGAAWTVPLVAVAVAAPAFAASGSLGVGTFTTSCKCMGPMGFFRLSVSFNNTTGTTYTINGTALTSSTAGGTVTFVPQSVSVAPGTQVVVFEFKRTGPNPPGGLQISLTYNTTPTTGSPVTVNSTSNVIFPNCGSGVC
jgi:hypothetical protein